MISVGAFTKKEGQGFKYPVLHILTTYEKNDIITQYCWNNR